MPLSCCGECEHWYPLEKNNGRSGLCAANYMHEMNYNDHTCRNYEKREGDTYFVDENGKKV